MNQSVVIGSDHAGFEMKQMLHTWLRDQGIAFEDVGVHSPASADYPDVAHPLATAVEESKFPLGILLCGSANGVAITANKHQGIRAAICWTPELAELARLHNDANVLCLPARFISDEVARDIVTKFLSTAFEGGRHQNRVNKISC